MSNSIIDQQRDNALLARSPYNGKTWVRDFFTGENPDDFYITNTGEVGNIETLFKEIQTLLGPDNRQIANS